MTADRNFVRRYCDGARAAKVEAALPKKEVVSCGDGNCAKTARGIYLHRSPGRPNLIQMPCSIASEIGIEFLRTHWAKPVRL